MPEEFYIRAPDSTDSRGPYSPAQIASLAEADQVTQETLYYDEGKEAWATIVSNEELAHVVFPTKKRLALRAREAAPPPLQGNDAGSDLSVDSMLAAAEGQTEDTRHRKRSQRSASRAASLSPIVIGIILLLSATGMIYPSIDLIQTLIDGEESWFKLLSQPGVIVGAIDILFALACFLAATEVYPLIRFRVALGLGFFGYYFWAMGDDLMALGVVLGSLSVFVATMTLSIFWLLFFAVLGIVSMGYFALMSFL